MDSIGTGYDLNKTDRNASGLTEKNKNSRRHDPDVTWIVKSDSTYDRSDKKDPEIFTILFFFLSTCAISIYPRLNRFER